MASSPQCQTGISRRCGSYSSAWLRAARYGYMFYIDSRNGQLSYRPGPKEISREERLRRALPLWRTWLEQMEAVPPITAGDRQAAKEAA